jgi:hypothetical protein
MQKSTVAWAVTASKGVILAGVLASIVFAQAGDTVPWKSVSAGQLTPTADPPGFAITEVGVSTHVGKFTQIGTPTWINPNDHGQGAVTWIVKTAASGDQLFAYVAAISMEDFPVVEATIVIYDGTGRFKGATGSYVAKLTIDPATFTFTSTSTGTISTVGSRKP